MGIFELVRRELINHSRARPTRKEKYAKSIHGVRLLVTALLLLAAGAGIAQQPPALEATKLLDHLAGR
jgi:hypothetical protein